MITYTHDPASAFARLLERYSSDPLDDGDPGIEFAETLEEALDVVSADDAAGVVTRRVRPGRFETQVATTAPDQVAVLLVRAAALQVAHAYSGADYAS